MKSIRPKYFSKFQCDGKVCGSRCCKGWHVVADSETYQKYCSIENESQRQEILSQLVKSDFDNKKLFVKMKDDFSCPFLDKDSLCKIQKRYGEGYLTDICSSYPRVNYKIGEVLEQSLTLTCPVAAKLILLSETSMEFEEVEIDEPRSVFDWSNKIKMPIEDAISKQATAISILQNRQLTFNERLLRLCIFLQDEQFVDKIDLNFNLEKHAAIMIDIFNEMYEANMDESKKIDLKQIYITYHKIILQRLMENYAHIFENYMVNEFFMRCYPFAFDGGTWKNCRIFITGYKALEFAITLTAISKNGFVTVDEFLTMIDAVNEKLDHNRGGMKAIRNFAENTFDFKIFINVMLDFL